MINPTTLPDSGTTLGNVPQGPGTPSPVAPPAVTPTGPGAQAEGTVTISTKEFAELQRAKARSLSFEKRAEFKKRNSPPPRTANDDGSQGDPEILEQLRQEQEAKAEVELRAHRAEVTLKVRDLLEKEEFKALPASTKALILKNPHMLSEADNVEEALLDIEDFVRDEVAKLAILVSQPKPGQGGVSPSPSGHETPPAISAGAPTPPSAIEEEDVSKLFGVARSRAVLRNAMKKKARGQ